MRYPAASPLANSDLCAGDQDDSAFLTLVNKQTPGERGFYQDPQESLAGAVVDGVMKLPAVFPGTIRMSGGAMDAALMPNEIFG